MSKTIKSYLQNQFAREFDQVRDFMVISMMGIKGKDNNEFRGELLKKNIVVRIVKNSLAVRVFADNGIAGLDDVLVGPCAVAFGGDNIVDLAKELAVWEKKIKALEVKGACLEGEALNAVQAKLVAKMKSRAELQGDVLGAALSPGAKLVGAIISPASAIAGCLKTIIDKQEEAA